MDISGGYGWRFYKKKLFSFFTSIKNVWSQYVYASWKFSELIVHSFILLSKKNNINQIRCCSVGNQIDFWGWYCISRKQLGKSPLILPAWFQARTLKKINFGILSQNLFCWNLRVFEFNFTNLDENVHHWIKRINNGYCILTPLWVDCSMFTNLSYFSLF